MSRVIKKAVFLCLLSGIPLVNCGCLLNPIIGSGYAVSISVLDAARLKVADIEFLNHLAADERFGSRRVSSSSNRWECIHYYKDLDEPRFRHLQRYKFISLGYCYDFLQPLADTRGSIKQFYVTITNDWEGQEPSIKQEIDRLGDTIYKELTARFGKENVKVERRRTGPPF